MLRYDVFLFLICFQSANIHVAISPTTLITSINTHAHIANIGICIRNGNGIYCFSQQYLFSHLFVPSLQKQYKSKKSTTAAALLLNKTKYYGNNAHIFLNTLSFTHVIVFVRRKYIVIENRHELSVFLAKLFIPLVFEKLASSRHRHGICLR